ncbi:MAG: sugar ABC transporter substrate-binding protein [Janthinobacterium lividum]
MKRMLQSLALMASLATPLAAHAEKVGMSLASSNLFLVVMRNGMADYAKTLPNVTVQFEDAQNDVAKQLNQVQNFIAQKVDAIIVNPVDSDSTPKMSRLAAAAGIPIVYVNEQPGDKTLPPKASFVGSDEADSGTLEMKEVCRLMNGKGNIVLLMGNLSNQATRQRTQDVKDVISKPPCNGIKILDSQTANWDRTKASDLMNNWLSAGLKFDAVVSNNDEMAIGAIQALKAAKKFDKNMIVAGIDATRDGLASMKAGDLKVTVFQNGPGQGRTALDTALKLAKGGRVDPKIWIPFELVTPANLNQYVSKN